MTDTTRKRHTTTTRREGAGRRNGQWMPAICGGCGAQVSIAHKTPKSEAECRATAQGIAIERETPRHEGDPIGEIVAPDGFRFNCGEHALTFTDWRDCRDRLRAYHLVRCNSECDCNE